VVRFQKDMPNRSRPNDPIPFGEQRALLDRDQHRVRMPGSQLSPNPNSNKRPTVLIADDSDDTRQMFQVLLVGKGYQVIEASDGEQAVNLIRQERPGLVLLDLGLPRLNGLNVIHRLRKDLGLIEVPLVVITGYDHHFETAVAAGCDDYLVKPIDFDRLDAILDYYVPTMTKAMSA
jgi:two-component system, cell cycle response regulator DivK